MHTNDRKALADNLGMPIEEFDRLLTSANRAYEVITNLGPFYGRGDNKEPTFRVTAEPVILPSGSKELLTQVGEDILILARALPKLPEVYKKQLGNDVIFKVPIAWRIDLILDNKGALRINEIEGDDGASALMVAEQLAYNLQDLSHSTISTIVSTIQTMYPDKANIKIALVRADLENNAYSLNARKFVSLIHELSHNAIHIDIFDDKKLLKGGQKIDWSIYNGVINESEILPSKLRAMGVHDKQLLASASFSAIANKGVFAHIFNALLENFWRNELGEERLKRLQSLMATSKFISQQDALDEARKKLEVVKISWAEDEIELIDCSKGVAMPEGDMTQSTEQRWKELKKLCEEGYKIIAQEYIRPAKIKAYLRKKGSNLEEVHWYNRICVKYVVKADPNGKDVPPVALTAIEVTLGPNIVPAGRSCAFTAGAFPEDIITSSVENLQVGLVHLAKEQDR